MSKTPFHVAAFTESLDPAGVLSNIAAAADDILRVSGDDLYVPEEWPFLAGAYAAYAGNTFARAVLVSPSLQPVPYEIQPLSATLEPGVPAAWDPFLDRPVKLDKNEKLNAQMQTTPGAGAERHTLLAFLTQGPLPMRAPPPGARWVRFTTAAAALTASAWTSRTLTPAQNLPAGNYDLYGLRANTTSGIAARVILRNHVGRPGCLINDATTDAHSWEQYLMSHLGKWGSFPDDNLPNVEFFCNAADNEAQEVDLLVHKVA